MKSIISHRGFLQTSAALVTASLGTSSFEFKKRTPHLAFSTLGCPDWSLTQIVDFASQHGFKGIEVRGILRQMELPKCKEFNKQNMAASLRWCKTKGWSL